MLSADSVPTQGVAWVYFKQKGVAAKIAEKYQSPPEGKGMPAFRHGHHVYVHALPKDYVLDTRAPVDYETRQILSNTENGKKVSVACIKHRCLVKDG